MAQVCSIGIERVISQVVADKPWMNYVKEANTIEISTSPKNGINEYNIGAVTRSFARKLNVAINTGLNVGDVFIPLKRDGKNIVLIAPSRAQLELVNAKDENEAKEIERRNIEKEARGRMEAEQLRGEYGDEEEGEFFQAGDSIVSSKASAATISLVRDLLNRMGVTVEELEQISVKGVKQNINGIANIMQKLVQVAQDKVDVALPEEAMHFVVEILEQRDPALFNQLLKEINGYEMFNRVLNEYRNVPYYQTKDGKPDIRKIKKEAIAKVLVETVINKNEGSTERPELLAKAESWWEKIVNAIKNLFLQTGMDQAALKVLSGDVGTVDELRSSEVYLQTNLSKQDKIIQKLLDVHNSIEKKDDGYYVNGQKVARRVTDIVSDWYSNRFRDKQLLQSDYEKAVNDLKAEKGTAGHADIEHMLLKHFIGEDRTLLPESQRPDDSAYVSQLDPKNREYYNILKRNLEERLKSFGPGAKFLAETMIYNNKDLAGTVDFIAVTPTGKVNILDWKFMDLNTEKNEDVPWYKVNGWRLQMKQYKNIIQKQYDVPSEDFDQTRMIPIKVTYIPGSSKTGELPRFVGVAIGDVNVKNEANAYLLPVGLETERTNNKRIDSLIEQLNKVYEILSNKEVTPETKAEKARQLNSLYTAIRQLQVRQNIEPLLRQAKLLNAEIESIIKEYDANFKGKDPLTISPEERNEFSNKILAYEDTLDVYKNLYSNLKSLFRDSVSEKDAELLKDIRETTDSANDLASDLEDIKNEFAEETIAKSEGILNYLSPEKIIRGFSRWFGSTSTLQLKSTELLFKLANKAFGRAAQDTLDQAKILKGIKANFDKWAKAKGLSNKNYFDIIKKKGKNELIDEFDPEFYKELRSKILDKDSTWIRENIDVAAYNAYLAEQREKEYTRIKNKARFGTEAETIKEMKREMDDIKKLYNTTTAESPGWLLYDYIKKFPKRDKWESKEWKELTKPDNAPAKAFYDYIKERNEAYEKIGYIHSAEARTFLPFIRKSLMEKIVMGGQIKLGESLMRAITVSEGDVGFGELNPITKEPVYSIPKYFTRDTGEEVSDDLFRNMTLLNEMAIRYEYLSNIEDQMRLIVRVESNKEAIKTSYFGKTIYKEDGEVATTSDNSDNTKLVRDMMEAIVYGHKFVESENFDQLLGGMADFGKRANEVLGVKLFSENYDNAQISLNKALSSMNNYFQLKTLGLNPISALSNFLGGSFQSYINAGTYFTKSQFMANEFMIAGRMNGADSKKYLGLLEYFLPLTENYNQQIARELSIGATPEGVQEILMSLMRKSDQYVQSVNFFSYLDNTIVVDGKLENAREYLRSQEKYENIYNVSEAERKSLMDSFEKEVEELIKEKGVMNLATVEDGSVVIPGIERKSDTVLELRRKVQSITKDALGNLSDDDIRKINLNIYGKSFMIFKNWIPRLVDVRLGNLKYNSATDAYEWGRSRMVMRVLSEGVLQSAGRFVNILQANEKGIEYMREMYEKKKAEYEKDTGKTLRMTEREFIDLVRKNIKDQATDLVFYLTLTSLFLGLKAAAPDDDDDKATQNQYKFMLRVVDKVKDEVAYFYDPTSLVNLTKSGIFPSTSLIDNFTKMFKNFGKEMYYLGTDDVKAAEENKVVKYFLKGFPITYEFDIPILLFFPDLAKDLGMKAQSEAKPLGM